MKASSKAGAGWFASTSIRTSRTERRKSIDGKYFDELVPIAGPVGMEWSRKLAQSEGIFTGISGGGTFAVAMRKALEAADGSVILCMLPDTGERYLTSPLFEGIPTEMTEEETALSHSTPSHHMEPAG